MSTLRRVDDPPRVGVADLAYGAGQVTVLDPDGQVAEPLLLVDLDSIAQVSSAVLGRAAIRAGDSQSLLIGVASEPVPQLAWGLLDALDLSLVVSTGGARECVAVPDPWAAAADLAAAVTANPQACLVLGGVLRVTGALPVPKALEVESFAYSTLLGGTEFRGWLESRGPRPLPPPCDAPVLVRRDGDCLLITLNRPDRRNAYGRQLRDALTDALRVALLDPAVSRVVLDGAGACFCSGGDLDEFGTTPDLVTAHFVRTWAGAPRFMHSLGARLTVRVHGPCVGAGVELTAFAGAVTCAESAAFWLPEAGMGLIPGAGGTVSIPRRIGRWRTFYLAVTGHHLDAATALAWGLVDEVHG
jgi:Enoyl-CoA hydratase/isomerase